ncbi:MAG: GNAT family N-acetyltransferase [Clostridia bacterium]|nr:GNAT family N-acetyltransferase [Clostridia bacterium]
MLVSYNASYRNEFLEMNKNFYNSDAVLHSIPEAHMIKTADLLEKGTPFAEAYMIKKDDIIAGFVLLAITYSNEAGGEVVWIDELYIKPEYRGKGLGGDAVRELTKLYKNAARFRLEISPDNESVKRLYGRCGFENLEYTQMYIKH